MAKVKCVGGGWELGKKIESIVEKKVCKLVLGQVNVLEPLGMVQVSWHNDYARASC